VYFSIAKLTSNSYGGKGKMRIKFTTVSWAKRPEVQQAWKELAEQHDLVDKELREVERVFSFLDGILCRPQQQNYRFVLLLNARFRA